MRRTTTCLFLIVLGLLLSARASAQNSTDDAVLVSTAVDNTFICPDKKEAYLYVDLSAAAASKRIPLNIALVLDRSGSMEEEERLHNAKAAVAYLVDHLNPDDICSIIIYDHVAEVLHGASPVTDKEHLKKKIRQITPRGSTNIYMGLKLGYEEVKVNYSPDRINRVILLSDGLANQGITDDYMLELMARDHAQRENISLSSFGMGHEFNEKLMHNLAEYGTGNYYFVERVQDAVNDFGSEIKMLLGIVASGGKLRIKYPSGSLKIGHLFGFPYTASGDEILIDLKEVHPNEKHGVLVKFFITSAATDSIRFQTNLQYVNAFSGKLVSKTEGRVVVRSDNGQDCMNGFQQDVVNKIAAFSSNYYVDSAADHAERGDLEKAHATLESAKQLHKKANSTDPLVQQQYQLIEEYQSELAKNKNAHPTKLKMLHKKIRHKNYKLRKLKCPNI